METYNMKKLFLSPRFQGALLIGFLQALVLFNVITSAQGEGLILIVQGIIAVAIIVRTADRNGDKKVEAATITAGK